MNIDVELPTEVPMSLDKTLNLSAAKKPQIVDQKDARSSRLMKPIEDNSMINLIIDRFYRYH